MENDNTKKDKYTLDTYFSSMNSLDENALKQESTKKIVQLEFIFQSAKGARVILEHAAEKCFNEYNFDEFCKEADQTKEKWAILLTSMLEHCQKEVYPISIIPNYFRQSRLLFWDKEKEHDPLFAEMERLFKSESGNKRELRNKQLDFIGWVLALNEVHKHVRLDLSSDGIRLNVNDEYINFNRQIKETPDIPSKGENAAGHKLSVKVNHKNSSQGQYFNMQQISNTLPYCRAMANHCKPNDPLLLYDILFTSKAEIEHSERIQWLLEDYWFIAYLRYGYASDRMPIGINAVIHKYFITSRGGDFTPTSNIHAKKELITESGEEAWERAVARVRIEVAMEEQKYSREIESPEEE